MRYKVVTMLLSAGLLMAGCDGEPEQSAQNTDTAGQTAAKTLPAPEDGVIGVWRDNVSNPIFFSKITIRAEDGQLYLDRQFDDGSTRRRRLVEKESPLGRRFDPVPAVRLEDHWVIDPNGDLLLRDKHGTAATAGKIE